MTTEAIIRQSLNETRVEYIKNCSISGVNHICSPIHGIVERVFWLLIFGLAIATLIICLKSIWSSLSSPLIVSMESTNYPIGEIDFPAVVLCNVNRISKRVVSELAQTLFTMNKDDKKFNQAIKSVEELEWILIQFGRLIDFEYSPDLGNALEIDIEAGNGIDSHYVSKLMLKVAPDCETMLVRCMWAGKPLPCDKLFELRRTIRGYCCAFNYVLDDGEELQERLFPKIKRQKIAGRQQGLSVVLDAQIEDYAYPMHHLKGFDILLFDPKHYADSSGGRTIHRFIEANTVNMLELQSRKQLATAEVRKYSPQTRNCLFEDERSDVYYGMYSMSACISRCHINNLRSLCKCTPFFLPKDEEDGPVCTMADLWCLNKYKGKFLYLHPQNPDTEEGLEQEMNDSLMCPDCLPDCEHTHHFSRSNLIPIKHELLGHKMLKKSLSKGLNMTNKSILSVYQSTPDGTLDRLDVVFYWFEILSNFGGFAGILLGFSLATAYEWLFFFIFYFIKTLVHKISKNLAI